MKKTFNFCNINLHKLHKLHKLHWNSYLNLRMVMVSLYFWEEIISDSFLIFTSTLVVQPASGVQQGSRPSVV